MEKIYRAWRNIGNSHTEIALCKDRFTAIITAAMHNDITRIECLNREAIERDCVDELTWVRFLKRMVSSYEHSIDEYIMYADDGSTYTFEVIIL